ncbi:glycosyltransferase [Paucibacter sp. B2R-40]|uniref:glycosyltransferase n=1 Tax=Paucibacter sp. B2R-40 TaxID=2893554 RepID=UPI0021E44303|nr:glycosyltransferase [Paucibacter sp. B2R-40]MCV2357160.1 glycosyltransferase [Paucibacter sp. B2R-40]
MKFSIVTCTWNSVKTLNETIDSVQAQKGVGLEIEHIFVDGGSTDGTLEIISRRCPKAILLRDVGGGISHAMNAGIDAASGEVVAHLHSDDFFADPDVLAAVAEVMASGAMWAFGRIDVLCGSDLQRSSVPMQRFTRFAYASGSGKLFVPHPATFVRKQAFSEVGQFDEGLKLAMDIDLWMRLGWRHVPAQLDRPLAIFRDHPGSVSSANKLKARREELSVRRRYWWRNPLAHLLFEIRYLKRTRHLRSGD